MNKSVLPLWRGPASSPGTVVEHDVIVEKTLPARTTTLSLDGPVWLVVKLGGRGRWRYRSQLP